LTGKPARLRPTYQTTTKTMSAVNEFIDIPFKGRSINLKIKLQKFDIDTATKAVFAKGRFILDPKGVGRTVQFELDQSKSPDPVIKFRSTHKTSLAATKVFVRHGLNHWLSQRALGIRPGTGSSTSASSTLVSKLLKKGHDRKPHLKQFKSKTRPSFVPGTIVNESLFRKVAPISYARTKASVDALNLLAREFYDITPVITRAIFARWLATTLAI